MSDRAAPSPRAADSAGGAPAVVVVGSGIAGLVAALHAAASGCTVTLLTKDVLAEANTRYAQGGIAGVMFDDDSAAAHAGDTLEAGAGLSDPAAVDILVTEGPARIRELISLGVAFDRGADGAFVKGLEAAHSYPRVLHAGGDATGRAIEAALVDRVRRSGVRVVEHAFLADLILDAGAAHRVAGVEVLVGEAATGKGRVERLEADAVVLATGGAGRLYAHTTNPAVATGDGIAAALRAGADVVDLEFVQFHPTVLPALPGRDGAAADPFLVSEAVRGEGAVLRDEHGHRFMPGVHPDAELAPRDVVARAIAEVMTAQGGRPVLLDATALGGDFLARRFPTIDAAVRARGWDWAHEPIPVTPAAHYLMGGVVTDLHGRTSLPGLYAVGEVARTGVHGANRLASNSLLEGAVFGARAGDAIADDAASGLWPAALPSSGPRSAPAVAPVAPPFSRTALQALLWADAGLVRDAAGLARAAARLAGWRAARRGRTPVAPSVADLEDENLLEVATALVAAAAARPVSVGAHARRDDPTTTQEILAAPGATTPRTATRAADHLRNGEAPPTPAPVPGAATPTPALLEATC